MNVTRSFVSIAELNIFLRGGVIAGLKPAQPVSGGDHSTVFGLDGLTLVFSSPSDTTVTFLDPSGGGLSRSEILSQIDSEFGGSVASAFFEGRLLLLEATPLLGVGVGPTGTANDLFGFSTVAQTVGTVINPNGPILPYFVSFAAVPFSGTFLLTLEEEVATPKDLVSGAILQLDPDDPRLRVEGLGVSFFPNQAGGPDPVQTTDNDRPSFVAGGGANGHNKVVFDSTNSEDMLFTLEDASTQYTCFAVYDQTLAVSSDQQLFSSAGNNNIYEPVRGGKVAVFDAGAQTGMAAKLGEQIVTWRAATGKLDFYRDGELLASAAKDLRAMTGTTYLGSNHHLGGYFGGGLLYFVLFNRALTDTEVDIVNEWLAKRFAITFDWMTSIAGRKLDLDAADPGLTVDGLGVNLWPNSGSSVVNATQATDNDRPEFLPTGGVAGGPTVVFDASNTEHMDLIGMSDTSTDYTFFCVGDNEGAATACMMGMNGGNAFLANRAAINAAGFYNSGNRCPVATKTGSQLLSIRVQASDTSIEVSRDGELLGVDLTYTGSVGWSNPRVGAVGGGGVAWHFDGPIDRLILYNHALTTFEQAIVEAALLALYEMEFIPLSIANCRAWHRADLGLTGVPISAWANQGSLGGTMTPTGDSPTVSTLNGQASIFYDGDDDGLTHSTAKADWSFLHDGTGGTLAIHVKDGDGTRGFYFDTCRAVDTRIGLQLYDNGSSIIVQVGNGSGTWLVDRNVGDGGDGWQHTQVFRLETGHAANEYDWWVDGVSQSAGPFNGLANVGSPFGVATIGENTNGAGSDNYNGDVPEWAAYDRYLNDLEADALSRYFDARYVAAA